MPCSLCSRPGHNRTSCPYRALINREDGRTILSVMMELIEGNDLAKELSTDRVASWAVKILQGTAVLTEPPIGLCTPATPRYSSSGHQSSSQISVDSSTTGSHAQYLSIPVPVDRLPAIYSLLAEAFRPPDTADHSQPSEGLDDSMFAN
ncbi:hypothetical protein J8273_1505 [Carpediemonas membranifera]|uniref:Uncharacterized protein n=1 Tax=Carpediemonas membranifera TaxID=201153 RepID=A0A8J6AWD2_9EUKA|nr:hypothetical protein J8273_5841 [Carpediemonas membranifera]KAG9396511.1 hypothetical protein J8273_1505 [Carpediemonas membranifera]|eukprot:KAG9392804.1 hypothetical protein J8273_5841 [Carpediemonas membranifera]